MSGWTEADIPRLNPARIAKMHRLLTDALAPTRLDIRDDSHRHAGHAGSRHGQGHFGIVVESAVFTGKLPLARHRLVYAALGDMLQTDIHALSIDAKAPGEQG